MTTENSNIQNGYRATSGLAMAGDSVTENGNIKKFMENVKELKCEMANALTHGVGVLFGMAGLPVLSAIAVKTGNLPDIIGITIYAFGFLMAFAFSTLYHSVKDVNTKKTLRTLDHISIYI